MSNLGLQGFVSQDGLGLVYHCQEENVEWDSSLHRKSIGDESVPG